jgi:SAM-dependent methyltransferase
MIRETVLYYLARGMYYSEICHSREMKDALTSLEKYDTYRLRLVSLILRAAERYGVSIRGRDVLDFGCGFGTLCSQFLEHGPRSVTGVDIDGAAIARAQTLYGNGRLRFQASEPDRIPLPAGSVDVVISYDVFEHVARPEAITDELYRVLRPGGQALIGTWGWYHPFAPHLFSVMPVPWAHVLCGERAVLRACRKIFLSPWYRPVMHDLDPEGRKRSDKYTEESISTDYLNKYLIRDYERLFARSPFDFKTHLVPFSSWYARWTAVLLRVPWVREFFASYVWFVLTKLAAAKA